MKSIPRHRKELRRAQGLAAWLAGHWVGWPVLERSPSPVWDPLSQQDPILRALSGAAVGAAVGGIAGGLIGLGIPELEAKRYEGKVKAGNILLSVHTANSDEIKNAEKIFKSAGAEDICTTGESTAPKAKTVAVS